MSVKDSLWIDHLAALSSLSFEGEEKVQMAADMVSIAELMDRVAQAELSEEEFPLEAEGSMELLREDIPAPSIEAERLLSNAKGRQGAYFAVNKIMD